MNFYRIDPISDVTVLVRLRDFSVSYGGNCVDSGMDARDQFLSLALNSKGRMLKFLSHATCVHEEVCELTNTFKSVEDDMNKGTTELYSHTCRAGSIT